MAKSIYYGVGNTSHKGKKVYYGVNGVARKVKKMYYGDSSGKARLCFSSFANARYLGVNTYGSPTVPWYAPKYSYNPIASTNRIVVFGEAPTNDDRSGNCSSTADSWNKQFTHTVFTSGFSSSMYGTLFHTSFGETIFSISKNGRLQQLNESNTVTTSSTSYTYSRSTLGQGNYIKFNGYAYFPWSYMDSNYSNSFKINSSGTISSAGMLQDYNYVVTNNAMYCSDSRHETVYKLSSSMTKSIVGSTGLSNRTRPSYIFDRNSGSIRGSYVLCSSNTDTNAATFIIVSTSDTITLAPAFTGVTDRYITGCSLHDNFIVSPYTQEQYANTQGNIRVYDDTFTQTQVFANNCSLGFVFAKTEDEDMLLSAQHSTDYSKVYIGFWNLD